MMSEPMHAAASALALGFVLGLRHATDADHVVAVTTIVARERRLWAAGMVGVLWGLGHSLTLLVVGGAIVLFRLVIPPRIGLALELTVAAMLVALGTANVVRVPPGRDADEAGPTLDGLDRGRPRSSGRFHVRALVVGVVHGLAGSAAIALLVLSTIANSPLALAYLVIFGAGTIAGMACLTIVVALPFAAAVRRFECFNRGLTHFTGVASILFGLFIAHELVFVHGIFSSRPNWTPE